MKKFFLFLTLLTLSVGQMWGTEYTYTSFTTKFTKGTTNGTNISTQITGGNSGTNVSTIASAGSSNFASKVTASTYCYYNSSGAGVRIAKSNGAGNFTLTFSNALKDSTIYAIVLYASKVSGNTKAVLNVTPTGPAQGGYTTVTNIGNSTLPAYNATSYAANTDNGLAHYKLDTIKVNGKKIETLNFASASGGYTMLHAITIVTQTEKEAPAPSYTIIAQSNNNTYGTVSLSGSVITATPAANHRIASDAYTVTSGTATVERGTGDNINKFTVTPTSNCTVQINFEPIPTHKISFNTGGLVEIVDATGIKEGDTYNISQTPASSLTANCEYGTFVGWTTASSIANPSVKPALVSSVTMSTSDVTLYAVYSKTAGGGGTPTAYSAGAEGDFVIASYNTSNSKWYAIPTSPTLSSGKIAGVEITVNTTAQSVNYVTSANASGYTWTIADATNGQTLSDGTKTNNKTNYLCHSNGGSSGTNLAYGDVTYTWNIAPETNGLTFQAMSGSTTNSRGMLMYGTNFGGYSLSNEDASGYYRIQVLPIASSGTTTYSLDANCCDPLGSINGSVSLTQSGNSVTIKNWGYTQGTGAAESNISKYTVYLYSDADSYASPVGDGIDCTVANRTSTGVTFTGLSYARTYKVKITATPATNYCPIDDAWLSAIGGNAATTFQLACEDAELAYGTSPVAKTFGDVKFTNALTNSHSVAVTYASNDHDVATVDENGEVTIHGAGSATITASSIQQTVSSVKYCADNASYTLNVAKAAISPTLSYDESTITEGGTSSAPSISGNTGGGAVTYAVTVATPAGCVSVDPSTGVVTAVKAGTATITATIAATSNYNSATATADFTIEAASYFVNGVTVFIQAESSSAWDANACVKAWFNNSGADSPASETYWLFDASGTDNGKKLFATVVPASGNYNQITLQRFQPDCDLEHFWNANGTLTKASDGGSNTFRTYGSGNDNIAWNGSGLTMALHGDPSNDEWETALAAVTEQGAGIWSGTYENYAPAATSADFKIKTNYNGWIGNKVDDDHQNENATLDGMKVGSTYNVTATLDITDHSLTMSKTFVKGTVSFDMQDHGDAIDALTNVAADSKISAPSAPTATGYDFGGWYKEAECENEWDFDNDEVDESMTLYAKWTVHNYTISTSLTGVSLNEAIASSYPYTGSAANIARTMSANTGYLLPGTISVTMGSAALTAGTDYTYSEGAFVLSVVITGDIVISAEGIRVYTVTFNKGTGVCETGSLTQASAGAYIQLPVATASDDCTEEGWSFAGWSATNVDSETSTAPTLLAANADYQPKSDVTLYAVYQRTEAGSGTTEETASVIISDYATAHEWAGSGSPQVEEIPLNDDITATTNTDGNNGKYYEDWRFYHTDNGILTITAAENCTLKSATITFTVSKNGTLSGEGEDGEVTSETAFEISGSSYSFTVGGGETGKTNGQVRITAISVTYDKPAGSTTYYLSSPSCAVRYTITVDNNIANGSVSVSPNVAKATEGTQLTLTATPAGGYHFDAWNVYKTGDAETTVTVTNNQFNMPDYNVTISATFEHDPCDNLVAPTLNGEISKTYNSATIAWNEVSGATGGYAVSVVKHSNSASVFSGNVNALSKALADLEPETQYDYSIMAVGDGTEKCADGNGVLAGNFTTSALPTAHLTLIDINGEHASSGDYTILTPFNLPNTAAACSKEFYGWTATENYSSENDAPEYKAGDEFTFANTTGVTLFAVYADNVGGDESSVVFNAESYASANSWEDATAYTTFTIDGVTFTANGGGNNGKYYTSNKTWRLYSDGSLSITASGVTISSVSSDPSVDFSETSGTFTCSFTARTDFKSITVNVTAPDTYENYSTACAAAPEATADASDVAALVDVAAAGVANGTIAMTYNHVNTATIAVALYSNAACTEAFTGSWLTASINGDKNIAYTIAENTSYNDARTAYIKLTAPETTGATAPAVVIIPVSQESKPKVFASLADLAAAELNSGDEVTVTINNRITNIYTNYFNYRYGIYLNEQKYNKEEPAVLKDIEIYFNSEQVPASEPEWVIGGTVSGTITCPWNYYNDGKIWQLVPGEGWHWTNLTYTAPATVTEVSVSGTPDKDTYNTGEAFAPAGLSVHVVYSDASYTDITSADDDWSYITWDVTPATFAAEHIGTDKSVSATATYSGVSSTATEISGLTVNKVAVTGVTLNQNAATLKVGKKVTLTATVAPANATYKGIEWSTSDGSVATVENGVVTAVAAGTATITVTATDDNTKTATCAITVLDAINFAAGDWTLVTDAAELTAGSYVIIAAKNFDYAMKSYESGNNCGSKAATKSGDMLEYDEDFGIFEIGDYVISAVTYKTFQDAETDQYLYISTNNNRLQAQDTKNEHAAWTITSVSNTGIAVVTSKSQSSRTMRYNDNSDLFACYATGQADIALYKYYAPVPKVTYNKNTEDEVTGMPNPAIQRAENNKATIAAGPSRTGFTFTGWNSAAEGNGDAYTVGQEYTITEDIILYAQWTALPSFHVTYNTSGSQGTTPTDATNYYEGDEVTLASASGLSNAGYFFDKWVATYVDGNSDIRTLDIEDNKFTMPAFDVTVTATWARKSSDKWIKVTATSQLAADKEYIIVNTDATYAVGAQGSNNRTAAAIEENNGILTISDAVAKFTLGIEDDKYSFYQNGTEDNVDKGYLYAASSEKNYMRTQVENNANGVWTISMDENCAATVTATGTNTRNIMRYNPNNGSPVFSCYASNSSVQNPVVLYYKAPKIEINNGQTVNVSDAEGADIVVHNGGTLNVNAAKSIGDLTVENGGKVVLDANKLTVVGTFIIESTMASGTSGQLTGATASNFAANGPAYIDITLGDNGNANKWHAFTVPFPVDAINGVFDLNNTKLNNEEHYAIMEYLGDVRAQGKYGWKKYRGVLVPGTFYLMTVDGLRTTYRFKKTADGALVAGNTKPLYEYASSTGNNDNGWNGVGNPTLMYGTVNQKAQVLNPTSYTYEAFVAGAKNFVVGTPFFVQAESDGTMTMGAVDGDKGYYAPARQATNEIMDIEVTFGNEEYKDRLYISASEDALNRYETGKDLAKMTMTSTPKVAQIFGKAYNSKLCMVYAPMANDQAVYDLTLYAPANGEYTISAPNVENADLYLTYEGNIIWNLSMSAYPMELKKGNTEGYGLLLNAKAPMSPTGIENTDALNGANSVQKVILDEKVFILRGGKMYDVTGKAVK